MSLYNAEISAGSLMLPESRRIARLLLTNPTQAQWDAALKDENVLQKKPSTARRQARLIRNRLNTLDSTGWTLVKEGDVELTGQLLLAAAIRHSRLLGDFLRDVYQLDLRRLENTLNQHQWEDFLAECTHRDPIVNTWAATTTEKLFQVIVRILAEARFLDSSRKRGLTPPMLHPTLIAYLHGLGDTDTLSRMSFQQ
jgi:hypothetical protein